MAASSTAWDSEVDEQRSETTVKLVIEAEDHIQCHHIPSLT